MTTERLYYTDSYTTTFDADVIARLEVEDRRAVVLNRSYFYPTSGGQPNDTGLLSGIPVIDVVLRESDGSVLHVLDGDLALESVSGQINWARRFDHMQHHTGQHILSQAFVRLADAETVGFHLSPDSVTIDLNIPMIDSALVDQAEDLANQVVAENRPVRVWFPSGDDLDTLTLRKVPEVEGKFRVVDIDGFDVTACGGTHVAHTGEIGLIKVLRVDKRGDTLRVEFRCGERALLDYREKNMLLNQLAADMTTSYRDIPAVLEKLREENKTLRREVRDLRTIQLEHEAESLWANADRSTGYALIVLALVDRDPAEARQLVQNLIARPATVVLCGIAGEKAQLITARSEDITLDMVPMLKRGLAVWGVDRGGGRPSLAQGGGVAATLADVEKALSAAAQGLV